MVFICKILFKVHSYKGTRAVTEGRWQISKPLNLNWWEGPWRGGISRPGTHCLQWQWQRANARARKAVMTTRSFSRRNQDRAWVSFHPSDVDVANLVWKTRFEKKSSFNRAQDAIGKALVYSADCGACRSQGSHSNSAREISRNMFCSGWDGAACVTESMLH